MKQINEKIEIENWNQALITRQSLRFVYEGWGRRWRGGDQSWQSTLPQDVDGCYQSVVYEQFFLLGEDVLLLKKKLEKKTQLMLACRAELSCPSLPW